MNAMDTTVSPRHPSSPVRARPASPYYTEGSDTATLGNGVSEACVSGGAGLERVPLVAHVPVASGRVQVPFGDVVTAGAV